MKDFKLILQDLGVKIYSDSSENFRVAASFRGSSDPNILVNKATGSAYDFARGRRYSFQDLVSLLVGKTLSQSDIQKYDDLPKVQRNAIPTPTYGTTFLKKLLPQFKYWNDRGISDHVLHFTRGGLCHEGAFSRYFVFPIMNKEGRIYGFSGRDTTGTKSKKWLHDGRSSTFIYGPYFKIKESYPVAEAIDSSSKVYIVESIGDCLSMWEVGINNCIPSFGLSLSDDLISYILATGADPVISFNHDSKNMAGNFAAIRAVHKLSKVMPLDRIKICLSMPDLDYNSMLMRSRESIVSWVSSEYPVYSSNFALLMKAKRSFSESHPSEFSFSADDSRLLKKLEKQIL